MNPPFADSDEPVASASEPDRIISPEANKELIRRLYTEVLNRANPSAISELIAENYVEQDAFPGQARGRVGVAMRLAVLFAAFPDLKYDLKDLIAEGDKVVARWTMRGTQRGAFIGIPPTNRGVVISGIDIYVIENDQIITHWNEVNLYSFLAQVNALARM